MDGGESVGIVASKPGSHSRTKVAAVGGIAGVAKPVADQPMPKLGNVTCGQATERRRGRKAEAGK